MNNEIKTWTQRLTDGKHHYATCNDARDAEIAELRARIESLAADAALKEAVGLLIKAKGRYHTEKNFAAVVAAYDAAIAKEKA